MLKVITGDMVEMAQNGAFDVIIHGANCFHTMGAGIAKTIKEVFPVAVLADITSKKGDVDKLGSWTCGVSYLEEYHKPLSIINAYTQFLPGPNAEYAALKIFLNDFFNRQSIRADEHKIKYAFPLIGCGIGGLDEDLVIPMLEKYAATSDITLVKFDG